MATRYSVIQYVPDPVADERVNIGVIAFSEDDVRVRFLANWDRVRHFGLTDVRFLKDFARRLGGAVSAEPFLPLSIGQRTTIDAKRIVEIAGEWVNGIQFTEPRASLSTVEELIAEVAQRFLADPLRKPRGFRDRKAAARAATMHIREALQLRVGGDEAESLLKTAFPLQGSHKAHTFDAVVANGVPFFAAHGLSFEIPDYRRLDMIVDAVAWAITDVKLLDRSLPLAIVSLPPTKGAPHYKDAKQLFERTTAIYQDLGAEVLAENEVESWANRMVMGRLPIPKAPAQAQAQLR